MKRKDVRARTALVATALGVSLAITLAREAPAGGKEPSTAAYGSGNHGEWISDDFGLQAYRYTGCTAARAPCVATDDAVHQLGNDGVTALAHSGGYVELYSTRSYHRFANRYDASKQAFAGGFGWVRDGRTTWSMLYADRPEGASYERVFGMGYFEKTIEHSGLGVVHDVYMTEGDDAVLREHLVFTNRTPFSKSITYFDYWDVAWWHPRIINGSTAASSYDTATVKTRYDARLGALFRHQPGGASRCRGARPSRRPGASGVVRAAPRGSAPESIARGRLRGGLDTSGTLANEASLLATQKGFTLAPGQSHALDLAFGLAPRGEERALLEKQRAEPAYTLPRIAQSWAQRIPRVSFGDTPWLGREMAREAPRRAGKRHPHPVRRSGRFRVFPSGRNRGRYFVLGTLLRGANPASPARPHAPHESRRRFVPVR